MEGQQKLLLKKSQVVKEELAFQGKWLGMKYVSYSVGERINNNYECVYRMTRKTNCRTDGVEIVPIIKYKNKPSEVVLIANYRPPINSFCLQFPSGLVQNDNYEENVKRELLEQTGYQLKSMIEFPQPTLYVDPWKSNQSTIVFIGIIDGDDPNHKKTQSLQAQQNIRVVVFPLNEQFPKALRQFAQKQTLEYLRWINSELVNQVKLQFVGQRKTRLMS